MIINAKPTQNRFGEVNKAMEFDNIGEYILLPNSNKIRVDFPFSISVWFKIDGEDNVASVIFANDDNYLNHAGFWISYLPNGTITAAYGDGNGATSSNRKSRHTNLKITDKNWHNVIAIYQGLDNVELFIDCQNAPGYFSGSATEMVYLGNKAIIGKSLCCANESPHNGSIDDLLLFDKALSINEIQEFCNFNNSVVNVDTSANQNNPIQPQTPIDTVTLFKDLTIYPNPTKGNFIIDFNSYFDGAYYKIEIFNILGQLITSGETNFKQQEVVVGSWGAAGVYVLKIHNFEGVLIDEFKLVVR